MNNQKYSKVTNDDRLIKNPEKKWSFTKIKGKTVGEILEETRKEHNLTIEEAARRINTHAGHLLALESGDYLKLPGGVYSEKILENYADLLSIDFAGLKKIFDLENRATGRAPKQSFVPKISKKNFIVTPRLVEIAVFSVVIIIFLTYLGFEISNIFSPPPLEVMSPPDNFITDQLTTDVSGKTDKEVKVKINDQEIKTDAYGNFHESVSLKPGLNIIKISASKKRSKENIIYRQIISSEK